MKEWTFKVNSRIMPDGKTIEVIREFAEQCYKSTLDTCEKHARLRLIELGWTPPVERDCKNCALGIKISSFHPRNICASLSRPYGACTDHGYKYWQPIKSEPEVCKTCKGDKRIPAQQLIEMKTATLDSNTLLFRKKRGTEAWSYIASHGGRWFIGARKDLDCKLSHPNMLWVDCPDCAY
ncbi:hypothetical protein KAR91_77195 [Candidatus Pacearchaeota archaeon]|nr:hypothetical protein [Candidatus Pacearchaeota archaeon]